MASKPPLSWQSAIEQNIEVLTDQFLEGKGEYEDTWALRELNTLARLEATALRHAEYGWF